MQGNLAFQARYVQVNTRGNLERSRETTLRDGKLSLLAEHFSRLYLHFDG